METLRNKSSISRDNKSQDPYWMTIIEEDPVQEGLGTDFKKKRKGSDVKRSFASPPSGGGIVCEFGDPAAAQGLRYRSVKYYDPVTNADPPSMSEPASALIRDVNDPRLELCGLAMSSPLHHPKGRNSGLRPPTQLTQTQLSGADLATMKRLSENDEVVFCQSSQASVLHQTLPTEPSRKSLQTGQNRQSLKSIAQ